MTRVARGASTHERAAGFASFARLEARLGLLATVLLVLGLLEPPLGASRVEALVRAVLAVRVTSAASGRPIEGAEVIVYDERAGVYRAGSPARTDGDGRARLDDPGGSRLIVARAAGFSRGSVALPPSTTEEVDVALLGARPLEVGVRGRTADGSVALPNATVLLDAPERVEPLPYALATDGNGRARFEDVPEGELRARIFARGYAPYEARIRGDLLVELTPVQGLLVRVVDGGEPVPGATVRLSGAELWPEREVSTGERGEVRVQGLAAGTYVLEAEKGERVSAPLFGFALSAGLGDELVVLELGSGSALDVAVVSDLDEPIAGARLSFSRDGLGLLARSTETNAQGLGRLAPLYEARGTLLVAAPGHVERVALVEGSGPHRIVLDRVGTLDVQVVDERDFPVAGVAVSVAGTDRSGMPIALFVDGDRLRKAHFDWQRGAERRLVPAGELGVLLGPVPPIPLAQALPSGTLARAEFLTDERGRVTLEGVAPGRLRALAKHPDYLDATSDGVVLAPAGRASARIVLTSGRALRFRVLDHRDFPVDDARVTLSGRGLERLLFGSPDGTYRAPVAPGRVTVRISRATEPLRVLLEEVVVVPERDEEVQLRLPAPREDVRVVVLDERGERLSLAQIQLASRDPRTPIRETRFSSERGEAEFAGVRGLSCELSVSHPGFVREVVQRTVGEEERVTLARALALTGKVTVARGRQPAVAARVVVRGPGFSRALTTDGVGEYSVSDAPPGRYRVEAELDGLRGHANFVVARSEGGRPTDFPTLDLARTVRVRARVVDDRGFPVPGAWVGGVAVAPYRTLAEAAGEPKTGVDGFLELELEETTTELFAAAPGVGFGRRRLGEVREGSEFEIPLSTRDEVPPGTLGTVPLGLAESEGRVVVAVLSLGSDEAERLRVGDVLVEIERESVEGVERARSLLSGPPGTRVGVVVRRGGREVSLSLERRAFVHGPRG